MSYSKLNMTAYDPTINPATGKKRTDLVYSMTGQNPAFGQPLDPSLGVTAAGGSSQPSQPSLPSNYNFNDLASYEEGARKAYGQSASADILNTRNNLASSLGEYGKNFFAQQNPAILEDLNSRGLLTSQSEVANKEAQALKEIDLSNQSYLRDFDTSALSARLQAGQDALDTGSNLRSTGLEANLNQANNQQQMDLANKLAQQQGRNNLNTALIGAGGSVLGGAAPDIIKSLLAKKAAATTAATLAGTAGTAGTAAGTAGAAGTGTAGAGIGAMALPVAGAAAGLGLYEESRKQYAKHGYGNTESKILAATPLLSSPYVFGKEGLKAAGFGAGKTQNGNAIADTARSLQSQRSDLQQLQAAHQSGQINDADYNAQLLPALKQYNQMVNSALSQGSVWASSIKPEWDALVKSGMVKAQNGQWVTDTGQVLWDPQKGYAV